MQKFIFTDFCSRNFFLWLLNSVSFLSAATVQCKVCYYLLSLTVFSGTDEEKIIAILVSHSLSQRLEIKSKFTTMFGEVRILTTDFSVITYMYST